MWYLKHHMSYKNTSCWASVQKYLHNYFPEKNSNRPNIIFHLPDPRAAVIPATTAQLSTGWGRGVGCRICGSRAARRCSVYCGWRAWCCHLTAGHSWLSGLASLSFHMVCCSSATPLSPSWRASREREKQREKQELWGHSKCQNAEVNNEREGKTAECRNVHRPLY